jgi:hypothetical protein
MKTGKWRYRVLFSLPLLTRNCGEVKQARNLNPKRNTRRKTYCFWRIGIGLRSFLKRF